MRFFHRWRKTDDESNRTVAISVEYSGPRRIVIHNIEKVSMETLLNTATIGVEPAGIGRPLNIIDDVVFMATDIPIVDSTVMRYLSGTLDIMHFLWAEGPQMKDQGYYENPVSKVKVPLIRQDHNVSFRLMVRFAKAWGVAVEKEASV